MAKVAAAETTTPSDDVAEWLSLIENARKDMRDYEQRCDRIRRKYVYENSQTTKRRRFQMLWSNQEILRPAVYAKRPSPSVTNRWRDGDAVARITCELLERNLDFQFDICDYDHAFQLIRDDFLLFARGVCRLRYEPTFKSDEIAPGEDDDDAARFSGPPRASGGGDMAPSGGASDGEDERDIRAGDEGDDESDVDGGAQEDIAFESVHLDFVQLTDFIHPKCRTWKELPWVCYVSYLDREKLVKRFGDKIGNAVQLDTVDEGKQDDKRTTNSEAAKKATIYEIWDKSKLRVLWISPGHHEVLDSGDPYLKFTGFFPSPRPAYGTISTDSLVPHPDFIFYQDQAEEIDELTARIGHLTDSLKLVGFYPAGPSGEGAPEIEKAVRPGFENKMIAVRSWAAFAQGGKAGAPIVWLPVDTVGVILKGCVELRKQLIDDVYQLTGISDIIRGTTEAEETAAAQGLKSQWGSLRLNVRQKELARLAKDVTRMAAEVIANHFQISTLVKCANMKVPTEADNQKKIEEYQLQLRQFALSQQQSQMMGHNGGPPMGPAPPGAGPPGVPPIAHAGGPPQGAMPGPPAPHPMPPQGPPPGGLPASGGQAAPAPQGPPPGPAPKPPAPPQLGPTQEMVAELLKDGVTQRFLIDIETDSTIAADENAEKAARTQILESISKFIVAWMPIVQGAPELLPLAGEMLLFAVRAFPAARELEEAIEQAMDKMAMAAGQPKPPSGEQLKAQADLQKAQAEIQNAQIEAQTAAQKSQADIAMTQLKGQTAMKEHEMKMAQMQMQMQLEREKMQMELHGQQQKHQLEIEKTQIKAQADQQAMQAQHQMAMQAHQAQAGLEQQKQAAAQKTLAQTAAMDEQKMVAKQAMDQFHVHSKKELMEQGHNQALEMANLAPEPKGRG